MNDPEVVADSRRVLGYVQVVAGDLAERIAVLPPGECLRFSPGEVVRLVTLHEVDDDSWRSGIPP